MNEITPLSSCNTGGMQYAYMDDLSCSSLFIRLTYIHTHTHTSHVTVTLHRCGGQYIAAAEATIAAVKINKKLNERVD